MPRVFVADGDGASRALNRVRCENEDRELQRLLQSNPELLAGEQMSPDDPLRWLLVKREMPVPDPETGRDQWSVDFLFVDHKGVPTFVECKRFSDTRSRREVVGQMLDYVANGHYYLSADQMLSWTLESQGKTSPGNGSVLQGLFPGPEECPTETDLEFFLGVERNLKAGMIRVVFFLEEGPSSLKSIVDFLNRQMQDTEVYLVEAQQYEHQGNRFIVPVLFGYTEQARRTKKQGVGSAVSRSGPLRKWDMQTFVEDAEEKIGSTGASALQSLYSSLQDKGFSLSFGTGRKTATFNAADSRLKGNIVNVSSDGRIYLYRRRAGDIALGKAVEQGLIGYAVRRLGLPESKVANNVDGWYFDFRSWSAVADSIAEDLFNIVNDAIDQAAAGIMQEGDLDI